MALLTDDLLYSVPSTVSNKEAEELLTGVDTILLPLAQESVIKSWAYYTDVNDNTAEAMVPKFSLNIN